MSINCCESYIKIYDLQNKIYTDQTGRFPANSSAGHKYVMVALDYDSNHIHGEPMKSRTAAEITNTYKKIQEMFTKAGLKPKLHILDNECSETFKKFMISKDETWQLAPPHIHRRNAAERAIQTWKNHFIAGLASLNKQFPMHLWCRLIYQANLTLNLLRQSRFNPKLSAHAQVHGNFDFNATTLAPPPGTQVIVHEKPSVR